MLRCHTLKNLQPAFHSCILGRDMNLGLTIDLCCYNKWRSRTRFQNSGPMFPSIPSQDKLGVRKWATQFANVRTGQQQHYSAYGHDYNCDTIKHLALLRSVPTRYGSCFRISFTFKKYGRPPNTSLSSGRAIGTRCDNCLGPKSL